MTGKKDDKIFRMQGGDPNGLDIAEFCIEMSNFDTDVARVCELNLDAQKHEAREKLHQQARRQFQNETKIAAASSPVMSKNKHKPGGATMMTQGNATGRVVNEGADELGRWAHQEFVGRDGKLMVMISAHQSCEQQVKEGDRIRTLTAAAQQTSALRVTKRDIAPRKAFVADLDELITRLHDENKGVLSIGDFNEELGTACQGMAKTMSKHKLVDVMHNECGRDDFNTWTEGGKRIDCVLADDWIAASVAQACCELFKHRNKGDHRRATTDFCEDELFGDPTHEIAAPMSREFSAEDRACNRIYTEKRHDELIVNEFQQNVDKAKTNWLPSRGEALDKTHKRACKTAAEACKKEPNTAFVRKMAALRREKNVLARTLSGARLKMDFSNQVECFRDDMTKLMPGTVDECEQRLKVIQKLIKDVSKSATSLREIDLEMDLNAAGASGEKQKVKMTKRLMKAENTKKVCAKVRACKGGKRGSLTRIKVPEDSQEVASDNCTEWISTDAPVETQEHLTERNEKHFG